MAVIPGTWFKVFEYGAFHGYRILALGYSVGFKEHQYRIVADPAVHPFETFNTYEKAVEWMRVNQPLAYKMLVPLGEGEGLLDFKILKHYAHHTGKLYSEERRALPVNQAHF